MGAREVWSKDTAFSARKVDFATAPMFTTVTRQLQALIAVREAKRIVEVGSGSGRYLAYLKGLTGMEVLGSDIGSPRLRAARDEHPEIEFMEADAGQMVGRYARDDTVFLAMNVLGNLDPTEVQMFFDGVTSAVVFCARGLLEGDAAPRESGIGWDHNYNDLLKGFAVLEFDAAPTAKFPGRDAVIASAYRAT